MTDFNECTVVDERSQRLGLPLPHPANSGLVDVMRLREAFDKLDEQVVGRDDTAMLRTSCTENLTLYVRTDGNDNNDGLSAITAKKTVQAAVDALANYDGRGNRIVINVGAGIFEASVIKMDAFRGAVNADLIIQGSGKGVTTLRSTESRLISNTGCELNIRDLSLEGYVLSSNNGWINITGDVSIKATVAGDYLVQATRGGTVMINPNSLDVAGDAAGLFQSYNGGRIEIYRPTVNFIGSPAFSDAVCKSVVADSAIIWNCVNQWTGICTGRKYIVDVGSSIYCGSIKPDTFLPGTKDGEIRTNGVIGGQTSGRTSCKSALTLYVRTDGNDSNDGLSNTASGAKKTIQAAENALVDYDLRGYSAVINIGAGSFAGATIKNATSVIGAGMGQTKITGWMDIYANEPAGIQLSNLTVYCTRASAGITWLNNVEGFADNYDRACIFYSVYGGNIVLNGPVTCTGKCHGFFVADLGGNINLASSTVTFSSNAEAIGAGFVCARSGRIEILTAQFVGSFKGCKYSIYQGGEISGDDHQANPEGTIINSPMNSELTTIPGTLPPKMSSNGFSSARGLARALVSVSSAGAIQKTLGVASVTRSAVGKYLVTFINAAPDTTYLAIPVASVANAGVYPSTPTTTNVQINTTVSGAAADAAFSLAIYW